MADVRARRVIQRRNLTRFRRPSADQWKERETPSNDTNARISELPEWEPGDYFVVPNWSWYGHENRSGDETVLFFMSDRPLLEPFGLYRAEYRA